MRFIKDNLLLLTLCVIVGVATLDSKNVLAGGDPSIKDSKVKKQKVILNNMTIKKHMLKNKKNYPLPIQKIFQIILLQQRK